VIAKNAISSNKEDNNLPRAANVSTPNKLDNSEKYFNEKEVEEKMWGHFLETHKAVVVGFTWRCNEIALANLPRHWHCQNFYTPHFPCLLD
jgi:hypothetical protein